jgi:hypothetical protein
MSCAVCGRAQRGFGWTNRARNNPIELGACSMRCLDIIATRGGKMYKLNHFESKALDAASDKAGAFLEGVGKSDLATMTAEEWRELLATVFVAATAEIQRLTDEDAVPF